MLRELEQEPRPHLSRPLDVQRSDVSPSEGLEPRRIRMDSWRIVYVIEIESNRIYVLAIRKRPPYRYEDLDELLEAL
jgi:mRNA interferase RelE/StbE